MRTKYTLLAGFFFFISVQFIFAQNKYKIELKINVPKDTKFYLGHYFGAEQQVTKDTAKFLNDSLFVFEGNKELPTGQYVISAKNIKRIEFVLTPDRKSVV